MPGPLPVSRTMRILVTGARGKLGAATPDEAAKAMPGFMWVTPDEVAIASALHEVMHLVSTNLDEKRPLPEGWPVDGEPADVGSQAVDGRVVELPVSRDEDATGHALTHLQLVTDRNLRGESIGTDQHEGALWAGAEQLVDGPAAAHVLLPPGLVAHRPFVAPLLQLLRRAIAVVGVALRDERGGHRPVPGRAGGGADGTAGGPGDPRHDRALVRRQRS